MLLEYSNGLTPCEPAAPWEEDSEASVWGRLSLHHRLHLIAELAIGLFVPGEPLPRSDAIHVVAFHVLLMYVNTLQPPHARQTLTHAREAH
jgi:hypothetical protein